MDLGPNHRVPDSGVGTSSRCSQACIHTFHGGSSSSFAHSLGNGLPLVPPTAERVKWMRSGTNRRPDEVLGTCPLKHGTVTIEKIAINAAKAGTWPKYLPAFIATMEAFVTVSWPGQDGEYFFHTVDSSGAFNLTIIGNGPIAKEMGMNPCTAGIRLANRAAQAIYECHSKSQVRDNGFHYCLSWFIESTRPRRQSRLT